MTGEEMQYEVTEVKAIRGTEAKAIASKQQEGWELVTREPGLVRTTLTFRRPKPEIPWRLWAALGGAGVVLAGIITVVALVLAPSGEPAEAEPVVATATTSVRPTPSTTTSAPPTTTLPLTTTAEPEPEPVILEEEDAYVAPAPLVMQPDVDTPPVRDVVPEPVVQAPPPPPVAPAPAPPVSSYYSNCTEAWAAGAAPIYRGEPGYSSKLDRDGDGVACQNRP